MTLDWTTFLLQIINFLALVWILKHFLYKPILATLAQRSAAVEHQLGAARSAQAQADAQRAECERRAAAWTQEKASAREQFAAELASERERQLQALATELAAERERHAALDAQHHDAQLRELEATALAHGSQFVSALLQRLAGPALEAQLIALFLTDLPTLPEADLATLRESHASPGVSTAFALDETQRSTITMALSERLDRPVRPAFAVDPELLAGLRITLGAWQLNLSLADELRYFTTAARLQD